MPDDANLDSKYFIDSYVYNCPFCNRRNVSYEIEHKYEFDWTDSKKCYIYLAKCKSCKHESMHLSFKDLKLIPTRYPRQGPYMFGDNIKNIDDLIFYSVPTSFFAINSDIPKILRELFTEAEGCLKSNFLTGASACARKIVYELAKLEGAIGNNYEERIKSLKSIKPEIDPTFFDTLLTIQQIASDKVHENAYDNWQSKHIRVILSSLREILNEIYVIPKLRGKKRQFILELKESVLKKKTSKEKTVKAAYKSNKKDNT